MADPKRKRPVRSVTLDEEVMKQLKAVGLSMTPKEESLSRLLDRAAAEFVERHGKAAAKKQAK